MRTKRSNITIIAFALLCSVFLLITSACSLSKIHNIYFEENGGTSVENITGEKGTPVSEPTAPTKVGYTFEGWYTSTNKGKTLSTDRYTFSTIPSKNITLYAKWKIKTYNITYVGDIGSVFDGQPPNTHTFGTESEIPDLTKTGYTFEGWKVNDSEEVSKDLVLKNVDYGASISLEACFTANQYTITFVGGDDAQGTAPIVSNKAYGETFVLPDNTFTNTGYTFSGWKEGNVTYEPNTSYTMTVGNKEFTAVWALVHYPLTLIKNDGIIDNSYITYSTYTYTNIILLPRVTQITRQGYAFLGWTATSDTDDTTYIDRITRYSTGPKTFYARWAPNTNTPYTVEYYMENLDGTYSVDDTYTQSLTGTTGSSVRTDPPSASSIPEGFEYDEDNTGNNLQDTIAGDGTTALKLYFYRKTYTITFVVTEHGTPQDTSELVKTYKYKTPRADVLIPTVDLDPGYMLKEWVPNNGFQYMSQIIYIAQDWTFTSNIIEKSINVLYSVGYSIGHDDSYDDIDARESIGSYGYDEKYYFKSRIWDFKERYNGNSIFRKFNSTITFPDMYTVEGHTLIKWALEDTSTTPYTYTYFDATDSYTFPTPCDIDNMIFISIWRRGYYSIDLNDDNAYYRDGYTPPTHYEYGDLTYLPKNTDIFRNGYTFDGWYSDETYSTKLTTIYRRSKDNRVIYPKWIPGTYTVALFDQGLYNFIPFSGNEQSTYNYTCGVGFSLPTPTRDGYRFVGWYTTFDGDTTATGVTTEDYGDKYFYARWELIE